MTNKEYWKRFLASAGEPWEQQAAPQLRDVIKREHDKGRPRDEAPEKWGPVIEEMIWRDFSPKISDFDG
jgi:hypothetical protein